MFVRDARRQVLQGLQGTDREREARRVATNTGLLKQLWLVCGELHLHPKVAFFPYVVPKVSTFHQQKPHQWFSGKISRCHRLAPGSSPG